MNRRYIALLVICVFALSHGPAAGDEPIYDDPGGGAETVADAVRVTIVRSGNQDAVAGVTGGAAGSREGCVWSVIFAPDLEDAPYGTSPGPRPGPEAMFALLLCNGQVVQPVWIMPDDVIDLDAVARDEAQRYIEDVLVPDIAIGVNPAARGLVGLRSWFWIDGFDGSVTAPPITAFGMSIEVRMASSRVTWDFGDGETLAGDLGRAYPAESTVQHAHRTDGTFTIEAVIELVPEYRVDGGPWLTLPELSATATADHDVEERQPVITGT